MFLEICIQIHCVEFALRRQINKYKVSVKPNASTKLACRRHKTVHGEPDVARVPPV